MTTRQESIVNEKQNAFSHFYLAGHLWNQHRVWSSDFRDLTVAQLSAIHSWYNCPPGEAARYRGCHMRLVPRRWPRRAAK